MYYVLEHSVQIASAFQKNKGNHIKYKLVINTGSAYSMPL